MTTFALIHGAWGVPGEWDRVVELLRGVGHDAIAVDIPVADPTAGLEEYADAVVSALAHVPEPIVVVGQSAGGHAAALIPSRRPVARVVYLTAFVPVPGRALFVRRHGEPLALTRGGDVELVHPQFRALIVERGDGTCELDPNAMARFMTGDRANDGIATLLASMLRPNGLRAFEEPWPRDALPDVPSSYLLCTADPVLSPASQRAFAARLGVSPIELPGGDHGVHMKRPRLVADALARLA
jgi:pimeloyl-ACP methyl ester carboxylesterase